MNIKEIREKAKLTQTEFGKRIGVKYQTILLYEKGKKLPESVQKLIRYEFASYLPEGEGLYSEPLSPDITQSSETVQRLQQRVEELEKLNEELQKDKEDLKRDKKMLQMHIETLTGKPNNNNSQQTA